eukprot:GGOE01031276.1.p1 GENE.GGOE01031276.1~~GGOE01031276.1.p1  ORF type:complete len:146 (-),score=14.52 GGOE01031276.1:80-517(-)
MASDVFITTVPTSQHPFAFLQAVLHGQRGRKFAKGFDAICFPRHSMSHTSLPTRRRAATHAAVQQSLPLPPLPSQVVVNVGEPPFCTRKCNSCDPKAPLLQPCSRPLLLDYCKPLSHPSEEGTSPSAALCPGSLPTQQVTSPVVL